ncbi:MAG: PKD domain-containing protein [Tepidisphaeraceae bacterium]
MKNYNRRKSLRQGFENLENRRLLSSIVLNGTAMELHGDADQDNAFVVRAAPSNRILGFTNNFGEAASLSTVQQVVIYLGANTDTVTVCCDVNTPVEVIGTDGTSSWLNAGVSETFQGSANSSNPVSGSSNSGSGTSSTGTGASSTGSGSSSSGSGSSSSGSGSSSTGSGSSSTSSGSSSTGSGSSSTGSGSSSTGSGSSSTGSGSSSTGSGSSSTGSGSSSTGTGSSSTGGGSSSTGSGSSSTGGGSSSTGSGSSSSGSGSSSDPTPTPSNPNDPATPNAVITLTSPATVYPLESVNVQAVNSNFGSGTVLNSTITWDFGDPGSEYNTLVGYNAAHAYANPGTYTITLSIATPDGHVGVATQTVTIAPDNRPTIYVAADGNDANDGSSPNDPCSVTATRSRSTRRA